MTNERYLEIETPSGVYSVWTRRVGEHRTKKLLLLHGGPGATHEGFEIFEQYLAPDGIEFYYYDQLGSYRSDQPDEPELWSIERFVTCARRMAQTARPARRRAGMSSLTASHARIMMPSMRTTVTLDPDVAAKLKELAHKRRESFKATLNDVLRRGLAPQHDAPRPPPFVVEPHSGGFRPGIDPGKLNQLVDKLEVEDFVDEAGRSGT